MKSSRFGILAGVATAAVLAATWLSLFREGKGEAIIAETRPASSGQEDRTLVTGRVNEVDEREAIGVSQKEPPGANHDSRAPGDSRWPQAPPSLYSDAVYEAKYAGFSSKAIARAQEDVRRVLQDTKLKLFEEHYLAARLVLTVPFEESPDGKTRPLEETEAFARESSRRDFSKWYALPESQAYALVELPREEYPELYALQDEFAWLVSQKGVLVRAGR
jgi:hypothetical protein